MTKLNTSKQTARRPARREFVIGDGNECSHSASHRTYLGHQGSSAFYQCQRCDAVIIRTPATGDQQLRDIPAADYELQ